MGVLAGLPDPFTATRYHSLAVVEDTLPDEIEVTGRTDSGVVMAMRHRELPIEGVQFHPESVLTEGGHRMLANWLGTLGFSEPHANARRPWSPRSSPGAWPRSPPRAPRPAWPRSRP